VIQVTVPELQQRELISAGEEEWRRTIPTNSQVEYETTRDGPKDGVTIGILPRQGEIHGNAISSFRLFIGVVGLGDCPVGDPGDLREHVISKRRRQFYLNKAEEIVMGA
jgi:hypothetical protein